jgi:hypothetical protein
VKSRKVFVSSAAFTALIAMTLLAIPAVKPVRSANSSLDGLFRRVATHDVNGAVAEIVAATTDGRTLIYTNSADEKLGFVNVTNPAAPIELASLDAGGEPTSVTTTPDGKWALAVVNATQSKLLVVDLSDRSIETTIKRY